MDCLKFLMGTKHRFTITTKTSPPLTSRSNRTYHIFLVMPIEIRCLCGQCILNHGLTATEFRNGGVTAKPLVERLLLMHRRCILDSDLSFAVHASPRKSGKSNKNEQIERARRYFQYDKS